jgi:glycosyltransferase involved in cell wall biosynthesis
MNARGRTAPGGNGAEQEPMAHMQRGRVLMVRAGGWEQWVETVAHHLGDSGFDVHVLVAQGPPPERKPGSAFSVVDVPGGHEPGVSALLRAALQLRRSLSSGAYDVLYVVDSWSAPVVWLATLGRLRWRRLPLVYHTFEWIEPKVHGRMRCWLEERLCRHADLVVNIDRVRGRVQQLVYGLDTPPLWIRNGLSRDYPIPPPSASAREALLGREPPADSVVVLSPSAVGPERMGLELIRAMALLPPRFRLAMIRGRGPYQDLCAHTIDELKVADRVTLLPRMSFEQAMAYVANADIGAVFHNASSRSLGDYLANPMRISMFAACGVPVVATDLPTVSGDLYRYGLGLCADGGAAESIAETIRDLADSNLSRQERKETIRKAFVDALCFESGAGTLERALRELVNDAHGA